MSDTREAICLTPSQVRALRRLFGRADKINGNVVLYGAQHADEVEFCWAGFDHYLHSATVTPTGAITEKNDGRAK